MQRHIGVVIVVLLCTFVLGAFSGCFEDLGPATNPNDSVTNQSALVVVEGAAQVDIIPIAIDWQVWIDLLGGAGTDDWSYDPETKLVAPGSDGVLEATIYPTRLTAGNFGTVDIGDPNNSTADLERQILFGLSEEDLAWYGGQLLLDENGTLFLNGDTGISAGIANELEAIIGKPRIFPVFSEVVDTGNTAQYTIVGFAGARIMDVVLTGGMDLRRVVVQPTVMTIQ